MLEALVDSLTIPRTTSATLSSPALPENPADGLFSAEDWVRAAERFRLTARELSVAVLIIDGQTRSSIARRLGCAPGTVRVYIDRLFAKLNVQDRLGVALRLMRVKLQQD